MRPLLFCMLAAIATSLFAQKQPGTTPRLTNTTIPADIFRPSTEKYKELVASMQETGVSGDEKRAKRRFYLESSFIIDDLLQSGMVVFNDTLNTYLKDVITAVLKDEAPELLKNVQFFVLKSTAVNAFAAPNGMVFVNLGLLARVQDEAQLALILSHELTHITHKHALELYLDASGINAGKRSEELISEAGVETAVETKKYSRELELEADDKAIQRMVASRYDLSTLDQVFDILATADLPYENIPFSKGFWENVFLIFPEGLFLNEIPAPKADPEEDDDENGTHPNIGKRRNLILSARGKADPAGRMLYVVSRERFEAMQTAARKALPGRYLHKHQYQDAIYHAYLSLLNDPDDASARKVMAQALFSLACFRNNDNEAVDAESASPSAYEGEIKQVYHVLDKLTNEQLTVLALANVLSGKDLQPNDPQYDAMAKELMIQLRKEFEIGAGAFSTTLPQPTAAPANKPAATSDNGSPKASNAAIAKSDFHFYALGTWAATPAFQALYARADSLASVRKEREAFYTSTKGKEEIVATNKKLRNKGARLDIHSVVVVNPRYLRIDARKRNAVQFIESETGELRFIDILKENAALCQAKVQILDPLLPECQTASGFNDLVDLNEWVSEQIAFGQMPLEGYQQLAINDLADRYETDFFLWTGVVSIRQPLNDQKLYYGLYYSIVALPIVPVTIFNLLKPQYQTIYYALLYNARTGGYQLISRVNLPYNDTGDLLHQHVYDTFLQLSSK